MDVKSAEAVTNRTLRVAAIQMVAEPGESASNRARAEPLVERAASDGAALVALPEMFAPGYLTSRGVWDLAEPLGGGPTVAWLQRIARRFGIHVAGGLVETDGRHFFDTFVVCTPAGEIAGRACKANAESYVFLRGRGTHIVDTSLGRLGIAICADNQFVHMPSFFHAHAVDLVLMPHAWPIRALLAESSKRTTFASSSNTCGRFQCSMPRCLVCRSCSRT